MEEVNKGKLQFKDMLYSEYGKDADIQDTGLELFGDMKRKVSYAAKVITKYCPWNKAIVTKKEVLMADGVNSVCVKWVKVKLQDILDTKNKQLIECFEYISSMIKNENNNLLYTLWTDAMSEKKYNIDAFSFDSKSGQVLSITFRFVMTKWNGSWEESTTEKEVEFTKPAPKKEKEQIKKPAKSAVKKPAKKEKEVKEEKPLPPNAGGLVKPTTEPKPNKYIYDEATDTSAVGDFN